MPLYTYQCPVCKELHDVQRPISERATDIACPCGAYMDRVFTAPNIAGDLPNTGWRNNVVGYDAGLDEVVLSETHRKEIMKRKGLREYEPDAEQKKIRDEQKYIKKHGGDDANKEVAALAQEATKKRRTKNVSRVVRDGLKDL